MFAVGALHCGEDVDSYHFEAVVGVQDDDQERARVFFVFFKILPLHSTLCMVWYSEVPPGYLIFVLKIQKSTSIY